LGGGTTEFHLIASKKKGGWGGGGGEKKKNFVASGEKGGGIVPFREQISLKSLLHGATGLGTERNEGLNWGRRNWALVYVKKKMWLICVILGEDSAGGEVVK